MTVTMEDRMMNVEKDINVMKTDIKWIKDYNISQTDSIQNLSNKLDNFVECLPKSFAIKSVEKDVQSLTNFKYYVIGAFAVVVIVLGLIINFIQ